MKRFFTYILLTSIAIACHIETPQRPASRFTFTPGSGCKAPCTVTFTSDVENPENLQWDFGDGTVLAGKDSVRHVFATAKSYQVKLIVRGPDGGSSGSTQTVKVDEPAPVETFGLPGGYNFPTDILSDPSGNIYISGTGRGTIEFGNGKKFTSVSGSDDFFVAKYNSSGQCQWLYTDGSTGEDHANAIALDSNYNVYVTGFISGPLANEGPVAKGGGYDGFIAQLDGLSGQSNWFKTFGGPLNDQGRSLAFFQAAEGPKIYLVGTVEGDNLTSNVDFNGKTQKAPNGRDGFLVILEAREGNFGDPYMIQGPDIQAPETVTVDDQGNAYIAGAFLQSIKFHNTSKELTSVDSVDVFVAKWGLITQNFLWASRAGSNGVDFAYDIEMDKTYKNVFVTGMHSGSISELNGLFSGGDENVYLGKWSADGKMQTARNGFTNGGKDYHGGIARTPKGNIIIAGSFYGTGSFPMAGASSLTSIGSTDIIITEVEPNGLNRASQFLVRDGGATEDRVNKICVTNTGYVYVAGWFYDRSTFNKVTLNGTSKERNTFVARYKL